MVEGASYLLGEALVERAVWHSWVTSVRLVGDPPLSQANRSAVERSAECVDEHATLPVSTALVHNRKKTIRIEADYVTRALQVK